MALKDIQIKTAKPKEKDYKLTDGGGLYLLVTSGGSKLWRFKYRFDGKEKLLAIGAYPDLSLAEARGRRQEARIWWQTASTLPRRERLQNRKEPT
jgi:hypothetical protein